MTKVTAQMVKELRDRTGLGMSKCKNALEECEADIEKAIELLRKEGLKAASKKKDRVANEGLIFFAESDSGFALVEMHCETDFVSKTDNFKDTLKALTEVAAEKVPADKDAFLKETISDELKTKLNCEGNSVVDATNALTAQLGENIGISRVFAKKKDPKNTYGFYSHNGGMFVSFVELSEEGDSAKEIAEGVAMHITAMQPEFKDKDSIPADVLEKEKEITLEKNADKPDNIKEKIAEGAVKKFCDENCLMSQKFIKDEDKTIEQYLGKHNIVDFVLWQVGVQK